MDYCKCIQPLNVSNGVCGLCLFIIDDNPRHEDGLLMEDKSGSRYGRSMTNPIAMKLDNLNSELDVYRQLVDRGYVTKEGKAWLATQFTVIKAVQKYLLGGV